jgi:hypothetical protein
MQDHRNQYRVLAWSADNASWMTVRTQGARGLIRVAVHLQTSDARASPMTRSTTSKGQGCSKVSQPTIADQGPRSPCPLVRPCPKQPPAGFAEPQNAIFASLLMTLPSGELIEGSDRGSWPWLSQNILMATMR